MSDEQMSEFPALLPATDVMPSECLSFKIPLLRYCKPLKNLALNHFLATILISKFLFGISAIRKKVIVLIKSPGISGK